VVGISRNARNSAKEEKSDGRNGDAIVAGYYAMRELVEQYRAEEKQAGQQAQGPKLPAAPLRIARSELVPDGIGDQGKNQKPAQVHVDGDSEYSPDFNSRAAHEDASRAV
jgi:hypothetical protein